MPPQKHTFARRAAAASLLGCLVTLSTACRPSNDITPLGVLPPAPARPLWLATVRSTTPATLTGAAAVTVGDAERSAHALISIAGAEPGMSYGWYIAAGACDKSGRTLTPAAKAYPALVTLPDGSAAAEAALSDTLVPDAPYVVVVQSSGDSQPATVACAPLGYGRM